MTLAINDAISGKFGKIKARSDCDVVNLGILGSDQYQLIAQQIDVRVFLLRTVVHPLQVSGGKYVRWRGAKAALERLGAWAAVEPTATAGARAKKTSARARAIDCLSVANSDHGFPG